MAKQAKKQSKNQDKNQTLNQMKNQVQDESIRPSGDISINSDVLGSYTGVTDSDDPYERPIQDADDL